MQISRIAARAVLMASVLGPVVAWRAEAGEGGVRFSIAANDTATYGARRATIWLVFENRGTETVRLFSDFDSVDGLGRHFLVKMKKQPDDPYVAMPYPTKVSFPARHKFRYLQIRKGDTYRLALDLAKHQEKPGEYLQPGSYTVQVVYVNKYGEDCVEGWLESNTIKIEVTELRFSIATKANVEYTRQSLPVLLAFENVGEGERRVLAPPDGLTTLLSLDVAGEDGSHIEIPASGGTDVAGDVPESQVFTIREDDSYQTEINLADMLAAKGKRALATGRYTVRMSYANKAGQDCVKGRFESNPLQIWIRR